MKIPTSRLYLQALNYRQLMQYKNAPEVLAETLDLLPITTPMPEHLQQSIEKQVIPKFSQQVNKEYLFFTLWIVVHKEKKCVVGDLSFKGLPDVDKGGVLEIGYGTYPAFRNQSYMTEAVGALVRWAFQQPDVHRVVAETKKSNAASIKLLQKVGFTWYDETEELYKWELNSLQQVKKLHLKKAITPQTNIKKVAFICPYPYDTAPGQRFRYEQYLGYLSEHGIEYEIFPFLDEQTNTILYKKGHQLAKVLGVLGGFVQRFKQMNALRKFDYVFVFREASPLGPPIFEYLITKVLGKKMIVDFDDAIWINKTASGNPLISWLRNHRKIERICAWSYKVSCGNEFLCDFARQFNPNVVHVPTTLDTEYYHNRTKIHEDKKQEKIIIGWTGTLTTLPYLDLIFPTIKQLNQQFDGRIELRVIANFPPKKDYPFVRFVPWNASTEIEDLLAFDIGIMPMSNTEWERGKCGFKALQYMSLAIPAVVSPVGVNSVIVQDGRNGFIADKPEEWAEKLGYLIESTSLRTALGLAGQRTVLKRYSVLSQQANYLALFD